jgi:hypothetical protein
MPLDNSRQRSLHFLILATLRKYVSQSNDVPAARELAKNLVVIESEDNWEIVTTINSEKISTTIPKTNFKFYATKDVSAYEIEPSQLNAMSAKSVVEKIFNAAGIINTAFPVNINVPEHPIKTFSGKINSLQLPIIFFVSLFMHWKLIDLGIFPYLRVIFVVYVVFNFIGIKIIIKNLSKYLFILAILGTVAFLARFNLSSDLQLIFVVQLFLIEIVNYSRNNLLKIFFLIAISICTNCLILTNIYEDINKAQIGILILSLSSVFLNISKCLKIRTKSRQSCLLGGLLLFGLGLMLLINFSFNGICGLLLAILIAIIAQLTSSSRASTQIYVGAGWVISA